MPAIVVIDAHQGSLDRYEIGGRSARKTHACTCGCYVDILPGTVELFRTKPPEKFSCEAIAKADFTPCDVA